VHSILREFYEKWHEPITAANKNKARELLSSITERLFEYEADTFRNRREKELFLTVMAERFLDAEEEFWKQGMRPAYLEQKIEHFKLTLSDGTEVMIEGKIDRIDVDEDGNFIIVDYKTGGYPQPKMDVEQDIFQLPVYAVMAQQALSGKGPALKKPVGLAYYDLKGKTGAGARDVVLYNKDMAKEQPASKPKASQKTAGEFEAILNMSMDNARRAVEGILAGDFTATPRDESTCRYCPNEMMCEKE
jgi:ATP-dependent helicase/DNAse subunit B